MQAHKTTLGSGLTVITAPLSGTCAITALVLVKVGSRYEMKSLSGGAHFIEHLMFKGTERRPSTRTITRILDKHGAEFNAFTGKEITGYYIKIVKEQLPLAMDILEDMLYHSLFKPEEVERERGVICEEINMYEDNPLMSIGDAFEEIFFGKTHPLGRDTAGTREVIHKMTRSQLVSFQKRYYQPDRTLVVVTGNVDPHDVQTLVQGGFLKKSRKQSVRYQKAAPANRKHMVMVKRKETAQAQIALGVPSFSARHRDRFVAQLLAAILGGSMSSRLFIQVRERRGLAYSIHANTTHYEDAGYLTVFAGVDPARIDHAIQVIQRELAKISETGVSPHELADAKSLIEGKMLLKLEDSATLAQWYGQQYFAEGAFESPEQYIAHFEQVTKDDIIRIARQLFRQPRTLAVIGPFTDTHNFQKML